MNPNPTCDTCPNFSKLTGECRADSPRVFPLPGPGGSLNMIGVWPPTRETNWCSQHPLRPQVQLA